MNPNYSHTITLYNCLKAADNPDKKDVWYRHVLTGCYYKAEIVRTDTGTNVKQQNTYTVRIHKSGLYKPYAEWVQLDDADRKRYFTLHLDDIVVYGAQSDEISGASGQTAVQVMNRYKPDAFKVTAVSDNTRVPYEHHYRLGG